MASLLAEIRDLDVSRPALRRFGFWVGGVLLGLGGWMWLRGGPAAVWLLVAGGGLVLAGAAAPGWLQWLYRFWMGLSLVLGHVVGTVLLVLVFYGVLPRWDGSRGAAARIFFGNVPILRRPPGGSPGRRPVVPGPDMKSRGRRDGVVGGAGPGDCRGDVAAIWWGWGWGWGATHLSPGSAGRGRGCGLRARARAFRIQLRFVTQLGFACPIIRR